MKFNKFIAFGLAAALLLSGCGNTVTEDNGDEDNFRGNSIGNINNLGSLCYDGEYIYYQKADENYHLYKSKVNGGDETALNDATTYFINSYKDKIYYSDGDDNFAVYSMNKDGSDKKKIIDAPANYLTVYKDNIYYADVDQNSQIFKADLDGKNITNLSTNPASYVTCYGNKVYYINLGDNQKIYSVDTDGSNNECVVEESAAFPTISNDVLYYTIPRTNSNTKANDYIYAYSLTDETSELILDRNASELNVYNGKIYFKDINKKKICNYDIETGEVVNLVDEDGMWLNIAGNNLFYVVTDKDNNKQLKSKEL